MEVNIGEEDVVLVKRLGKPGANKLWPVFITLSSEDKKRQLFKNLGIWRSEVMKERDPNDETPYLLLSNDYTIERRKEKNNMLTVAKKTSRGMSRKRLIFGFRVKGPPHSMHVIKMDTRTRMGGGGSSQLTQSDFKVEYDRSDRAMCKQCKV